MKKISSLALLLLAATITIGCEDKKEEIENTYGVDFESENVLACTNLSYNYLSGTNADILENHLFLVEYDENKTDILRVKEVYTADISKKDEKVDDEKVEELKEYIKTSFCEPRMAYITPSDYEGEEVTCDVTFEDDVVAAELTYPKEIIDMAVEKGMFGSLEEVKTQLENGEFAALKRSYFTCDKEFDKSTFVTKELNATLNIEGSGDILDTRIKILVDEVNLYVRFRPEVLKEFKADTGNDRVNFESINGAYIFEPGDYNLTYSCAADSEETCNKVFDYIINYIIEDGVRHELTVTRK